MGACNLGMQDAYWGWQFGGRALQGLVIMAVLCEVQFNVLIQEVPLAFPGAGTSLRKPRCNKTTRHQAGGEETTF
jgi:hypothetical protein